MGGSIPPTKPVFPKLPEPQVPVIAELRGFKYLKVCGTIGAGACKVLFGQQALVRGEEGRILVVPLWTRNFHSADVFPPRLERSAFEKVLERANAQRFDAFIQAYEKSEGVTVGPFGMNIFKDFARNFWEVFVQQCIKDSSILAKDEAWNATTVELETPIEACAVAYEFLKLRQNGDSPETAAALLEIRQSDMNAVSFEVIFTEDGGYSIRSVSDEEPVNRPLIPPPPPRPSTVPSVPPPIPAEALKSSSS